MANNDNLKRGPIKNGQGRGGLTPGGGDPTAGLAAIAANREQEAALDAMGDPDDVTMELFKEAGKAALRGYRKLNRTGKSEHVRQVIEASKEARQLAEVCRDIIRARGQAAESERVFAEMARRISAAGLVEGPRPVGEVARS